MPRRVQNGSKMTPKWLPGGLWAASGAEVAGKVAPGTLLGRSWDPPGSLLGRSRPLLGSPWGLQGVPRRVPEGLWEVILGALSWQGLAARKK